MSADDVVVQICPKCRCIYGFVNNFIIVGATAVQARPIARGRSMNAPTVWRFEYVHGFGAAKSFLVICWLRQRDIVASDSDIEALRLQWYYIRLQNSRSEYHSA